MKLSREIKIGVFVAVGIIILIIGFNFLKGFHPLKLYTRYHAVYNNVGGITPSTQVNINGLKIGQVEKISMLKPGDPSKILVSFIVLSDVKIAKGSEAFITASDLLGTKVIEIFLANGDMYLAKDDTLVGRIEESLSTSISKMVSPLKEKSEQVLVALDRVLNSMNDVFDSTGTRKLSKSVNDLSATINNVRSITERFDNLSASESERISQMLTNLESITRNLKQNNEVITSSLKNIDKITDSIAAADLTQTINNVKNVMVQLTAVLQNINEGHGTLGKLAQDDSLYINLNNSSRELSLLLKDMQEYPGRYVHVSVFGGKKQAKEADKKRQQDKSK